MAKRKKSMSFCENDGGFGIEPCNGSEIAVVDVTVDMEFTGMDKPTLHLCEKCAERLTEHAEKMGYEVGMD